MESALARIQLGQLASLPTDQNNAIWMLEVPVRLQERTDLVQMKIKRDGSKNANPEQQTWSIDIAFDLENLGEPRARIPRLRRGRPPALTKNDGSCCKRSIRENSEWRGVRPPTTLGGEAAALASGHERVESRKAVI